MTYADRFPTGTFFTLPPNYKEQRNAVLLVTSDPVEEGSSRHPFTKDAAMIMSCTAYWPDQGIRYYPHFRIWKPRDINVIYDYREEERRAMDALGGKVDVWTQIAAHDEIRQAANRILKKYGIER